MTMPSQWEVNEIDDSVGCSIERQLTGEESPSQNRCDLHVT